MQLLRSLTDREFLFVTGKGGVGKSSVCGCLGLLAAGRGKRTLIVCPQAEDHRSSVFGKALGPTPRPVAPGLDLVSVQADEAMRKYAKTVLKSRLLSDTLFHPRVAGGFLAGIPGLSDWAILGRSWAWTASSEFPLPSDERRYDLVIVDAPASGDGTKMLGIPQVIMDLTPGGRLRSDALACQKLLSDEGRSAVLLVSLAEELPVTETGENLQYVRETLGLPIGPIIVNRLLCADYSDQQAAAIEGLDPQALAPEACQAVSAAHHYIRRKSAQLEHLSSLRDWNHPLLALPEVPDFRPSADAIGSLSEQFRSLPPV